MSGADVFDFDVGGASAQFLRDAAIDAAHELGVFARVGTAAELARAAGVASARRLRALLDALVAIGVVARDGEVYRCAGEVPARPVVAREGWGRMAEVIRDDAPLGVERGAALGRLHDHLARAGAAAAREVVERVGGDTLLDLGGGAGAYTAAFLAARPAGRATVVDSDDVLALARDALAAFGDRVRFVAGDAREVDAGTGYDVVLLANVLHFYPDAEAARLCAIAARAVRPGGVLVVKDLRVDDDRRGPVAGLMFALNMAIYTDAGDVHATGAVRAMLATAGLAEVEDGRLAASPDSVVVIGRRPIADVDAVDDVEAELDAALATTDPTAELPRALRRILARAIAFERGRADGGADRIVQHYTAVMPRMRMAQLAKTDDNVFHVELAWDRLPRLAAALDRLFAVVARAGVDPAAGLGAATADAFRAATPTLAALHARTHYGGCMPLLYGYPADLAYFERRRAEAGLDRLAMIDRYLTAPVIHELCHFARGRDAIAPPHLDECIGGWLGVYVLPEFAYPAAGEDDAIYAAPWLAQVGQAIARGFGIDAVIRGHTGAAAWTEVVPAAFVAAAAGLGWTDWCARRTLHLLSDPLDPAPWVALALAVGAGRPVSGRSLPELAATPLIELADGLRPDPDFDRAIVEDGLRAMCLDHAVIDGSHRARTRAPVGPIAIDAVACRIARAADAGEVAPTYWLPPAVGARLRAAGIDRLALELRTIEDIPALARGALD